ncbi:hypothetical protein KKA95_02715 [Patescibacteria group bacterium]|nr:hypothetical protein [Patescibacteria group bacterium]
MADNNPQQQRERAQQGPETSLETTTEHFRGIDDMRKKAEAIDREPNRSAVEKIQDLRGNVERFQQWDEITAFSTAIVSVMVKVGKNGGDIKSIRNNPILLQSEVEKIRSKEKTQKEISRQGGDIEGKEIDFSLTLPESAALNEMLRIMSEGGDTREYLFGEKGKGGIWGSLVDQSGGTIGKIKKFVKEHPWGSAAIGVAIAGGLYLSYQVISSIISYKRGKLGDKMDKAGGTGDFFVKKILPALGALLGGGYLSKKMFGDMFGIPDLDEVERLRAKGEATVEDMQRIMDKQN